MTKLSILNIILFTVFFFSCNKDEGFEFPDSDIHIITEVDKKFLEIVKYSNNRGAINVALPYIVETDYGPVTAGGYLMLNRTIEFKDTLLDSLVSNLPIHNIVLERLFKKYFHNEKYDWTVNLILKKTTDLWAVDLNNYRPHQSEKWRKEAKGKHAKIWMDFFSDTLNKERFSLFLFKTPGN